MATTTRVQNRYLSVDAVIEFLDSEGFEVESDQGYGLLLPPNAESTHNGNALIDEPAASSVTSVNAKVQVNDD